MPTTKNFTAAQLSSLIYGEPVSFLNGHCYEGTTTRVRQVSGDELLTVTFDSPEAKIDDGQGGWIASRFGDEMRDGSIRLGCRHSRKCAA